MLPTIIVVSDLILLDQTRQDTLIILSDDIGELQGIADHYHTTSTAQGKRPRLYRYLRSLIYDQVVIKVWI